MSRLRAWLVAGTCVALGCRGFGQEEEASITLARVDARGRVVLTAREGASLDLRTIEATERSVDATHVRFGVVVAPPDHDVRLTAPVNGRLVGVAVSLGQTVTAHDIVVTIEPITATASQATLAARRAEIHARIVGGRSRIEADEIEVRRISRLVESELATPSQRARAEAALISERSLVDGLVHAEGVLRGFAGGRLRLAAPTSGTIAQLETRVGALVGQGDMLARILRGGTRWIDLAVPPDAPPGDAYRVQVGDEAVPAALVARGVIAHGGTRTDRIEVSAPNAAALLPGRTLAVNVVHHAAGLVVPRAAVVRRDANHICFVELHPGLYEPRQITLGPGDASVVILARGVLPGERVVVQGTASLLGELGFSRHATAAGAAPMRALDAGTGAR